MRILAVSDVEVGMIYSHVIRERFRGVDLIISAGDLPYFYLEYMISMLDVPLYYVHGNHANQVQETASGPKTKPDGGQNLHGRLVKEAGLLMTGVEGCLQYNYGPYQYSQFEMWMHVFSLVPGLFINKLRYGRYIDIFVTHAPPWHIHDQDDRPHQGIKAFVWFNRVFQPQYHLHGHIHVYRNNEITSTMCEKTNVLNVYGYREIEISAGKKIKVT
jgi:uncharacterized protein